MPRHHKAIQTRRISAASEALDLRTARQTKGVSLEQIAEATKISLHFLRAIEAEEFEKLPGGIFNTSYLRQYATAIGFDESILVGYYKEKLAVDGAANCEQPVRPRKWQIIDKIFRIPAATRS